MMGKSRLVNGQLLRSQISNKGSSAAQFYQWFKVRDTICNQAYNSELFAVQASKNKITIFGEALTFYQVKIDDVVKKSLVLYQQLVDVKQTIRQLRGKWDQDTIHMLEISAIVDIIRIWEPENECKNIYVWRKHPAITLLSPEMIWRLMIKNEDSRTREC